MIHFVGDVTDKIMTSQPIFQNNFILREPREATFADIIKL